MLFRETQHIFRKDKAAQEYFESAWMDYDKAVYPPTSEWSYDRELRVEDVDLWEVIMEWSDGNTVVMSDEDPSATSEYDYLGGGGGFSGIYAAWRPHAEFYMVKLPKSQGGVVTFYGFGAEAKCKEYLKSKGIKHGLYPKWFDPGIRIDRKGLHYLYKF